MTAFDVLKRFLAGVCTGSDEATLKAAGLWVDAGEQLMPIGDVLLRLRVMMVVRRGVVRTCGGCQTRIRIVTSPGCGQGVMVVRM